MQTHRADNVTAAARAEVMSLQKIWKTEYKYHTYFGASGPSTYAKILIRYLYLIDL